MHLHVLFTASKCDTHYCINSKWTCLQIDRGERVRCIVPLRVMGVLCTAEGCSSGFLFLPQCYASDPVRVKVGVVYGRSGFLFTLPLTTMLHKRPGKGPGWGRVRMLRVLVHISSYPQRPHRTPLWTLSGFLLCLPPVGNWKYCRSIYKWYCKIMRPRAPWAWLLQVINANLALKQYIPF